MRKTKRKLVKTRDNASKAQRTRRSESHYFSEHRIRLFSIKSKPRTSVLWSLKRANLPSAAKLKLPSKKSLLLYQNKRVLNLIKPLLSLSQLIANFSVRLKHRGEKSVNSSNLAKTPPKSLARYLSPRNEDLQLRIVQLRLKKQKSSRI